MRIIGIVGHAGSGKDTLAEHLIERGFHKISSGDVLREKMTELGIPTTRENLHNFAKEKRAIHGNSYPTPEIVEKIAEDTVIVGLRNHDEVEVFRVRFGNSFLLVAVEASLEARYMRARERNRIGDDISIEQFKAEEDREKSAQSGSHEVDVVVRMAEVILQNDGEISELYAAFDKILGDMI